MTRIGVAKHLRLLEEAGLVVSRRRGREKLHFLNAGPDPARPRPMGEQVHREPGRPACVDLKHGIGARTWRRSSRSTSARPRSGSGQAITDPEIRAKYHFGPRIESDWTAGSAIALVHPGADGPLVEGENLEVDPPRRLVQTMHALWGEDAAREGTSRVTWEIEPVGDSCRLTVTHDQLRDGRAPTSCTAAGR